MPKVLTKYFGSLEYEPKDVVKFPSGLPAFEEELEFIVIEPAAKAPLAFLQSLRQPGLCFLTLPILAIAPDYTLCIALEDLETLKLETGHQPEIGREIDCLAVIAPPQNGPLTANLLAPVIINRGNHFGVQAIRLDATYSHQYPVATAVDACS